MPLRSALIAGACLALAGCGSGSGGDETAAREQRAGVGSTIRFLRADGSAIRFPLEVVAWCGPWNDIIPTRAVHVAALDGPSTRTRVSYWYLWAVPHDVRAGRRVRFPVDFPAWNRPRGAEIFAFDNEDTPGGPDVLGRTNEASTQQEDSGGWITFDAVGCELGDEVAFTVDAVLGSEFGDDQPIRAKGRLRVTIGEPPPASTR
jgi:hypothetical protein